jgi:hypothetical protein
LGLLKFKLEVLFSFILRDEGSLVSHEVSPDVVSLHGHLVICQPGHHIEMVLDFSVEIELEVGPGDDFMGCSWVACILNCLEDSAIEVGGELVQALCHGGDFFFDPVLFDLTMVVEEQPILLVGVEVLIGNVYGSVSCSDSTFICSWGCNCWDGDIDNAWSCCLGNGGIVCCFCGVFNDSVEDARPSDLADVVDGEPSLQFGEEVVDREGALISSEKRGLSNGCHV